MRIPTVGMVAARCGATLFSSAASAAIVVYTFTGGGGISPQANGTTSGWMTENRTSFPGLSPATVLDNGVVSLVPGNWLAAMGEPFNGTYSGSATVTNGVVTGGTLSWTGQIGFEASANPGFVGIGIYALTVTNGSYNLLTGLHTGTFACAANPGGLAPAACTNNGYASAMDLPLGVLSFVDNGNGTVTLQMGSDTFTLNGGVKDTPFPGSGNGSLGYNQRVTWTLNATVVPDTDGDGISDNLDNCTLVPNPTQLDANADGYGNICDADINNSGTVTSSDFGLLRSVLGQAIGASATAAAADMNGSGTVTSSDFGLLRARLGTVVGPSGLACAGTIPCP